VAQGLIVGGGMVVALGAGAGDLVQINDSHFGPFTLWALGNAASVQIEAGRCRRRGEAVRRTGRDGAGRERPALFQPVTELGPDPLQRIGDNRGAQTRCHAA